MRGGQGIYAKVNEAPTTEYSDYTVYKRADNVAFGSFNDDIQNVTKVYLWAGMSGTSKESGYSLDGINYTKVDNFWYEPLVLEISDNTTIYLKSAGMEE